MAIIRLGFSSSQDITIGTAIETYKTYGGGFHRLSVGLTLISDNINLGKGNAYVGSYLRGFCLGRLFSWPLGLWWGSTSCWEHVEGQRCLLFGSWEAKRKTEGALVPICPPRNPINSQDYLYQTCPQVNLIEEIPQLRLCFQMTQGCVR